MRKRTPLPVASGKPSGQVIRHSIRVSTHTRIRQILNELGIDADEHRKEMRWKMIFKQLQPSM